MEGRQRRSFTDDYKRQALDLVASSDRKKAWSMGTWGLESVRPFRRRSRLGT
jgi:hypothetical protein